MNVLLVEDYLRFEKIAVRSYVSFLAAVIFLGGILCFLSSEITAYSKPYEYIEASDNLEIENSVPEAKEKLWDLSLQKRYGNANIQKIRDGVVHIKLTKYIKNKPIKINVIELNSSINENIKITPVTAGEKLASKTSVVNMTKRNNGFAGINGSYFKPQTGVPLGILMIDNKLLTGPIYDRAALGIGKDGYKIDRVSLDAKLLWNKNELTVNNYNQPRMLCTDVIVYTSDWGKSSPTTPKYGIQVSVEDGIVKEKSYESLQIPENGYVISGPEKKIEEFLTDNTKKKFFGKNNNTKIVLDIKINPDWENIEHIIGGGPFLVKSGQIYVDYVEEKFKPIVGKNPRTAIGYTKEGNLIMVTIDGREEKSAGIGLFDLAQIMKSFGCENAMNLDGGGSSLMQIEGKIVNTPSIKGGIAVSNALILCESEKIANR